MKTTRRTIALGFFGWVGAPLVLFLGCSRSGVEIQRMPDGSREFKCQAPLWKCLNYVDDLCKGASYEVLYARDNQHVYGTDQNHVEGHTSEAQVHCLGPNDHYKAPPAAPTSL